MGFLGFLKALGFDPGHGFILSCVTAYFPMKKGWLMRTSCNRSSPRGTFRRRDSPSETFPLE